MRRLWSQLGHRFGLALLLGVAGALAFPDVCKADLVTPIFISAFDQAQLVHLILGNLILGGTEAGLLVAAFGTPTGKTALLMVVANYASACAYFPAARLIGSPLGPDDLLAALPIALVLTVAIEAPFVLWCFPKGNRRARRWLTALVAAQVLSYALLVAFYMGYPSLFRDIHFVLDGPHVTPPELRP